MKLLHHFGRVLSHPSNTYFYSHWATAHTAGLPPRRSQPLSPESSASGPFS